ncbi:hypothetical protein BE21_03130 [Sorangium cellulosum]|jgi:SPW repeat-containing protein|uniref:SPW repeat-containing integral membrane domain-containing protein n=1 Tax=Sorangium cellulosum TaxID=56 RepID=A0A150TQ45_SORCE|nr:hypothetical protein BE21_03130 [Sorangium cellulosum]
MQRRTAAVRGINVALGIWLFISAFLWRHSQGQFTNAWVVGALCVLFALLAIWAPRARYVSALLAVWLFVSAWSIPALSAWTVWNSALVAIGILIASLVPAEVEVRGARTVPRL